MNSISSLYPNPTTGMSTLDFGQVRESCLIQVFSPAGRVVQQFLVRDESQCNIDLSTFSSGIYLVAIESGESREVIKLLRQ